jgi:hypothetical protein
MAGEWTAQLPDDLKTNETLTGYATLGDFAKAHLETHGKVSEYEGKVKDFEGKVGDLEKRLTNTIQKPSENATPEELAAFHRALGVPDKPEDYKFEKPKDLPAGLDYSDGVVQWWAQVAHKAGLSDKTAKTVFEEYNKMAIAQYNQQVKDLTEKVDKENSTAQAALKEKWGTEYDKNYELAVRCVEHFGGEEFGKKVVEYGLGNDPAFLEFMVNVSKVFKDDTLADLTIGGQRKEERKPGQLEWTYPSMPG